MTLDKAAAAWHAIQHAIFDRPNGCPMPAPGVIGAVLAGVRAVLYPDGRSPYLPVPARGQPCRFCDRGRPAPGPGPHLTTRTTSP